MYSAAAGDISLTPTANLAQLMRGVTFPNANILFNAQVKDPAQDKPSAPVPFDYPLWGRTVYYGWQAVDQAALDAYTHRKLASATSVTSGITVEHPILPDLRVNSVVEFRNTRADVTILCAVTKTSITFDPTKSVQTMTAYIVQVSMGELSFGTVEYQTIFAVGLTLFALTLVMNIVSLVVLNRFREVYE